MHKMLKEWITDHTERPVEWEHFKDYFIKYVEKNEFFKGFLAEIDWDAWIK